MCKFIPVAALCMVVAPAHAGELIALAAESIDLGGFHGVVYYTSKQDGYRIVTTIADGDAGLPVRFEATLADQQRLRISVPGKLGEQSIALEISRAGDKVVLSRSHPLGY